MAQFGKPGILERFRQLDEDLLSIIGDDTQVEMVIVGGSALLMLDLVADTRMTTDIDVLETEKQVEILLERYDMNRDVSTFLFRLADNWHKRRQRIPFSGALLNVYAPSNEDLVIMKLDAFREIDRLDIRQMILNQEINFEKLQDIINDDAELRVNYDNETEWETFLTRFHEIKAFADSLRRAL